MPGGFLPALPSWEHWNRTAGPFPREGAPSLKALAGRVARKVKWGRAAGGLGIDSLFWSLSPVFTMPHPFLTWKALPCSPEGHLPGWALPKGPGSLLSPRPGQDLSSLVITTAASMECVLTPGLHPAHGPRHCTDDRHGSLRTLTYAQLAAGTCWACV